MASEAPTKAEVPAKANGDAAPAGLVKPPKPDEEAFKKDLNQAEKDHKAVMVKFVRCAPSDAECKPPARPLA